MNGIGISMRAYVEGFLHGAKDDGGFDRLAALAEDCVTDPYMPGQLADVTADPYDEKRYTNTLQAWRCWGYLGCGLEAPKETSPAAAQAAIYVHTLLKDRT